MNLVTVLLSSVFMFYSLQVDWFIVIKLNIAFSGKNYLKKHELSTASLLSVKFVIK